MIYTLLESVFQGRCVALLTQKKGILPFIVNPASGTAESIGMGEKCKAALSEWLAGLITFSGLCGRVV